MQMNDDDNKVQSSDLDGIVNADNYRLIGEIGQGGMGTIFSVEDRKLNRILAVKALRTDQEIDDSYLSDFMREARITAELQHPNIIPIHEIDESPRNNLPYYTMKLIEGQSLLEVVDNIRQGEPEYSEYYTRHRLLGIFRRVCDAISYSHSRHIIHRDIKPANIMVGQFGEVLVLDWGLAKNLDSTEADTRSQLDNINQLKSEDTSSLHTMNGIIKGSIAYLSPEQAMGDIDNVDYKTDIFLLGATLYHILTFRPPYPGDDVLDIVTRAENADFTSLYEFQSAYEIPEALISIIHRCMCKNPKDRFKSVEELSLQIDRYLAGETVSDIINYPKGTTIIRDGEISSDTYVVVEGKLITKKMINGEYVTIDTLQRGTIFGELAGIIKDIRTADVVVEEDCQLLKISETMMNDALNNLAPWLQKIVTSLAQRASRLSSCIHPFLMGDPGYGIIKQLFYIYSTLGNSKDDHPFLSKKGIIAEISDSIAVPTSRVTAVIDKLIELNLIDERSGELGNFDTDDARGLLNYLQREMSLASRMSLSGARYPSSRVRFYSKIYRELTELSEEKAL